MQQDFELRKTVRGAGGNYKVIKNNLAEKASEGTPAEELMRNLAGMTSLAYTAKDPVALAKALTGYAKANPAFTFKAGMVEGRVIDVKSIQALATLPSREEILCEGAVSDSGIGAAAGDGDQRRRTQSGRGDRSGSQGKQVLTIRE